MKSVQTLKKIALGITIVAVFALIIQNIQALILPVPLEFYTFGALTLPLGIWLASSLLIGLFLAFAYEMPLIFSKNKALKSAHKELETLKKVESAEE